MKMFMIVFEERYMRRQVKSDEHCWRRRVNRFRVTRAKNRELYSICKLSMYRWELSIDCASIHLLEGVPLHESEESKNIRWISINELGKLLTIEPEKFYPMQVATIKKYLRSKMII